MRTITRLTENRVTLDLAGNDSVDFEALNLANVGAYANVALGEQLPGEYDVFERWTVTQWREIVMAELATARGL